MTEILMHLKLILERAMYVKLIVSPLSPTQNFQEKKNKENNTAWLF